MYKRQSVYKNPSETVSSNALAAASALGRALSSDGREVDRSKIPFYNSPSRSASMANLNSYGPRSNSIIRRNSMYVSTPTTTTKKKYVSPTYKRSTVSNNSNGSRRTASLPSSNIHGRNRNKLTSVDVKNAQNTFQEFGGPQGVSNNSVPNVRRTIKKYIPGPHGLIAIDVPVDDDIKRRQRGSYSLTSTHVDIRNLHSKNINSSRLNSGLHHHHNNNSNNSNTMARPSVRTRVSSDSLSSSNSSNGNSRRTSSLNNNNNNNNSNNNSPYKKGNWTLNKQRSSSSLISKTHIKNSNNVTLDNVKHTKSNVTNPKVALHTDTISKKKIFASNKENVNYIETDPLPMIESSMPEETELELELDLENGESQNLKTLETPSKIELDELMEENIELEEKLNEDFISQKNALDSPNINNEYDSISSEQDNVLNKIITNEHSDVHGIGLQVNNSAIQIDTKKSSNINKFNSIQKDEVNQIDEKTNISIQNDDIIEKSEDELFHVSNRSDENSLLYDEESNSDNEMKNVDTNESEANIEPILLNDKSLTKDDEVSKIDDVDFLEDQRDYDNTINKYQNDRLDIIDGAVSNKSPRQLVEGLGLQLMNNSYLEGEEITENARDASSDYITTEENPRRNTPDAPVPPPMSPKRHRKGVHSVRDTIHDAVTETKTTTENLQSQSENITTSGSQHDNKSSQNTEDMSNKKNRTTMADYLRSANPYLNKKDSATAKTQAKVSNTTIHSTTKKKMVDPPSLNSLNAIPTTRYSMLSNDFKPPPRLSQNVAPMKSALKKRQSYNSDNSLYNDNPANDAYLSLTTAENTRLNARMSSENLSGHKAPIRKVNRSQSMIIRTAQRPHSVLSKDIKKKSTTIERRPSVIKNLKRQSKIEPTVNTHNDLVVTKARELAQDSRMNSILYPMESVPKKSSFEKLRPETNHLGFKNLSLRTGMTNEAEYEQNNTSNKFRQRYQQMQPLTATMGYGSLSGRTSRFQDSDSDDDYMSPQRNYSKSNGKGVSTPSKVSSPSKLISNGISLFKDKKHRNLQESSQKPSSETSYLTNRTKLEKATLRTMSVTEQSAPYNKSELNNSQQRIFSGPQPNTSQKIHGYENVEDADHKKAHKFGNKLKKLFGRKK